MLGFFFFFNLYTGEIIIHSTQGFREDWMLSWMLMNSLWLSVQRMGCIIIMMKIWSRRFPCISLCSLHSCQSGPRTQFYKKTVIWNVVDSSDINWELVRNADLGSLPDQTNQNVHFNKNPRWSAGTFRKQEKQMGWYVIWTLAPRPATQMSPIEDKFNSNCAVILNNVAHHTPNKQSVDRVLELFLCVDLRRCWSVWISDSATRMGNMPAVQSALRLLSHYCGLQSSRSRGAEEPATSLEAEPHCSASFILCPASYLLFYYTVKGYHPEDSNFHPSLLESMHPVRKQKREIGYVVR